MDNFLYKFGMVLSWGIWPIYLAFFVIMCLIMNHRYINESPYREFKNENTYYNSQRFFLQKDNTCFIILGIISICLLPFAVLLIGYFECYFLKAVKNIEIFSSISMGMTAIAVTLAVVTIAINKKYYILFSINDILQDYKFSQILFMTLVSCVVVCISCVLLLTPNIISYFGVITLVVLEYAFIFNVLSVLYVSKISINIMFHEYKKELNLLQQLQRRFWLHKLDIRTINMENWDKENIAFNAKYLVDEYIKISKNKKLKDILDFEYVCIWGKYRSKVYNSKKPKWIIVTLVILILNIGVCGYVLRKQSFFLIIANIIAAFFVIYALNKKASAFYPYMDKWGYCFEVKNRKKFVSSYNIGKGNFYNKYCSKMNNLIAFFYIWFYDIKIKNSNDLVNLESQLKELVNRFESVGENNIIFNFPLFVIGYLCFEQNINIDRLGQLYKKISISEQNIFMFQKMIYSQVFYIKARSENELFSYRTTLYEYLEWLKDNCNIIVQ